MHFIYKKVYDQLVGIPLLDGIAQQHAARKIDILEKSLMYADQYISLTGFNLKPAKSEEIEDHIQEVIDSSKDDFQELVREQREVQDEQYE